MNQLEKQRLECGLTQQDVADAIGVKRSTVYRWETGASKPSEENQEKLDELFRQSAEKNQKDTIKKIYYQAPMRKWYLTLSFVGLFTLPFIVLFLVLQVVINFVTVLHRIKIDGHGTSSVVLTVGAWPGITALLTAIFLIAYFVYLILIIRNDFKKRRVLRYANGNATIEQRRVFYGLSQQELATELGVDRTTIYRWENGQSQPTEEHFDKIDEVFERMANERHLRIAVVKERRSLRYSEIIVTVIFLVVALAFCVLNGEYAVSSLVRVIEVMNSEYIMALQGGSIASINWMIILSSMTAANACLLIFLNVAYLLKNGLPKIDE